MRHVVKYIMQKRSRSSVPRGAYSEAPQGWVLKYGEDRKKLCTSVDIFVDYMFNQSPPWAAYRAFVSGRLIALNKQLGVCPVGVGEDLICLFTKCVLKVTGHETTIVGQDDHLCARLRVVIDGAVHRVQAIWDANSSTDDWVFYLCIEKYF